ncbi:MAG TPA: hypothetical protein PKI32_02070 [Opitutales bacterium]|nr:hypothetical protein [Opitutales bacterium]
MDKIVFTLIRYLLTAMGASEAAASDDLVTKIASGLIAIASVAWGLFEARRHAELAGQDSTGDGGPDADSGSGGSSGALAALCVLLPVAALAGCGTPAHAGSTASDPEKAFTEASYVAAPLLEGALRIAVPRILENNPELAESFDSASLAASAILAGAAPDYAGCEQAVRAAFPGLSTGDAGAVCLALESAWKCAAALYRSRTGSEPDTTALAGDSRYAAGLKVLAEALARGLSEGVADYRAAKGSSASGVSK